jgi:hypothetical protein
MVIPMKAPAQGVWRLVLSLALAGLAASGCVTRDVTAGPQNQAATTGHASSSPQNFILAGVWQGSSISDCFGMAPCRGLRHITFTMLPVTADGLDGFYRCEQVTAACDIYDDRGVITGASVDRRLLSVNVQLPDDQDCIFRSLAAPVKMEGRFLCKQRAIIVDRGVWRAERIF